ncbi:MAG: fimbrial protein [Bdellovibrionota bacterium]
MKKIITAALLTMTTLSFAATTATLQLKGTIAQALDISIVAEGVATSLNLTQNASSLKVATLNEKSNSNTGYKVTVSSLNNGKLKNGTFLFPYTLGYNSQQLNLNSPQTQVYSVAAHNVTKDVSISYTGVAQESLVAGDYTDTVTFTIAAN